MNVWGTGVGEIIAVGSGKGGVGKTFVSITLAHGLAKMGSRVLLIDADLGLANIDVQLGHTPRGELLDVCTGAQLRDIVEPYAPGGFDIIAGSSGAAQWERLVPSDAIRMVEQFCRLKMLYDVIILDLAPGLSSIQSRFFSDADLQCLIVTPDPTSITDAYGYLKLHRTPRFAPQIIVNQCRGKADADHVFTSLQVTCEKFIQVELGCLGSIRHDPNVSQAIRRQQPLMQHTPSSNASVDVRNLSAAILQHTGRMRSNAVLS